ncbi:hypothetical protein NEF87_004650 [Candidatus Lokiarchaeum ossiferum]|uniref:Transglutaminase-like domain-containing protein n=1 Tax=Candidatus Lokiarchaeum ossiferum TaxID=2951803 RepID=A0ABY6HY62_9ARCH|nr:hypothetical protein NEF87_004650 [Candidatus Lokiarchaeum sp. B-35]
MQKKKIHALTSILLFILPLFLTTNNLDVGNALFQRDDVPNDSLNLKMNYSIDYSTTNPSIFKLWNVVINSWTSNDSEDSISFQENVIFNNRSSAEYSVHSFDAFDIYNNSYDYYEQEMENQEFLNSFHLEYLSNMTLQSYSWNIPESIKLNDYNTSSSLYQFYTSSQPYCEANDTSIISKAEELKGSETSLVSIAQKIFLYLCSEMTYVLLDDPIGAKNALKSMKGDCSEFSSLMVALLRASGIPARKVLGFALIDGDINNAQPKNDIKVGDTWSYSYSDQNIPGHAWVQYYVPGYGWISADPTWGHSNYENGAENALLYFNSIDCVHIITTIGDFYGEGIDPELLIFDRDQSGIPEFPFVYPIGNASAFNFDLSISFYAYNFSKPIVNDFSGLGNLLYLVSSSSLILVIILIVYNKRKKKKNYATYYKNI